MKKTVFAVLALVAVALAAPAPAAAHSTFFFSFGLPVVTAAPYYTAGYYGSPYYGYPGGYPYPYYPSPWAAYPPPVYYGGYIQRHLDGWYPAYSWSGPYSHGPYPQSYTFPGRH